MSSTTPEEVSHRPRRTTTHRPLVLTALILAMFMGAIEATIVATAMPQIAGTLGGFSLYSWVFSSYLLMQAVTIPVFGKLADLLGRKPVFIAGIVVFLLGSVLCGFATSMGMLVAFRFIQGIGAGAVQPITATLAGDLYTLEERGRVQGYLSAVWGISAIAGPLAGGLIVQHAGWPWIFWINVPFGVLTIALVGLYLHEDVEHRERSIDYAGAGLLLVGLSSLMLALTRGADWGTGPMAALLALFAAAFLLFLWQERRAPDPIMHLEIWGNRMIALANVATLASGIAMIGIIGFLPTYVQGVQGGSALAAGFALSAMTVGWPLASVAAGRLFVRLGVRRISRAGGATVLLGAVLVALMADRGPAEVGMGSFVLGVGMGLLSTTFIVAIQTSVAWTQRGVATASNMLMRILGNALGAAVFGGVLNLHLRGFLAERGLEGRASLDSVQGLLGEGPAAGGALAGPTAQVLREGLSESLHVVFWGIVLFAAVTCLVAWRIPDLRREPVGEGGAAPAA